MEQRSGTQPTESARLEETQLARTILRCGQDADHAVALLDAAVAAGEQPGAPCYHAAISVCMRAAGQRGRGLELMAAMQQRGVTPDALCFQTALGLCAREPPLWREAIELVDRMAACGVGPTADCVATAIGACGRAGELTDALALLDAHAMDGRGGPLSSDGACLHAAIRACERCGDPDTARALDERLERSSRGNRAGTGHSGPGSAAGGGGGVTREEHALGEEAAALELGEAAVVSSPIGRLSKYTMGLMAVADGGKEAVSIVTPLAFDGVHSLHRVAIETGRTHQIRVHMASALGCPLAGDRDYGSKHRGTRRSPRRLVYLSAEGEETLETIDPAAVYVIGGLVDRNQHRGLSLRRAQDAGVSTARLPLEEYVQMNVEGKGRALTVNQCYELLLLRAQGHGWEEAVRQVMPPRRAASMGGV